MLEHEIEMLNDVNMSFLFSKKILKVTKILIFMVTAIKDIAFEFDCLMMFINDKIGTSST